ncbi:MAG: acylphosphatase [Rhodospirillaceae bacterium]|nr:acylphosphatase [Rhodospirillaceae bacterium]
MAERGRIVAVRVRIRGRVQGVAFRAWTMEEATARGLRGWVRNRRDGSVEAVFAGEAALVDDMVEACRHGPPAARVVSVDREPAEDPGGAGFRLLETA